MMDTAQAVTPRLLNIKQAAKYLGTAVWTLRDLEWRGELPAVRNLGRRLLFDIRDLDQLIQRKKERVQ
jgi:excisionase family DNA binding protein